jgi:predicted nucleic acid-binding protein
MIVVADTSPINYLVLIEEIDVLTKMYGAVVIPRMVREELLRPSGPEIVRAWISQPPNRHEWLLAIQQLKLEEIVPTSAVALLYNLN